jgi:hypothetical protein
MSEKLNDKQREYVAEKIREAETEEELWFWFLAFIEEAREKIRELLKDSNGNV